MVQKLNYEERCRDRDFPFHVHYSAFAERCCPLHTHEFAELVIVRHGRGLHVLGGRRYPLIAGDVFVVGPDDVHGYEDIEGLGVCNLQFGPAFFLAQTADLGQMPGYYAVFHLEPIMRHEHAFKSKLHVREEHMHEVCDLINCIEKEYTGQRPGFKTAIVAFFRLLTVYLSREYVDQEVPVSRTLLNLSRVVTYIESNYPDRVTLDALADVANMSKNSLLRAFKRCYNVSPIDFLIRHRLEKARELLRNSDLSITEVLYETGFSNSSYFTRQFREAYGLTPRDFRKTPD